MATLSKDDVIAALTRLGEVAQAQGEMVELLLLGGSLMVLVFETRQATRDVDVVILSPAADRVRTMAKTIATERAWPDDWLNDAAKGFMVGVSRGPVVFSASGITVRRPAIEQLLAMKLCAWRDDVDIADARRLLRELSSAYDDAWLQVVPYLQPGHELKAKYAFDDLWDEAYDSH
jgi:predicted nucleotidyltransferase